uniref:Transposase (Putative), gypsy type n=1 Tax=Tanacetum cinerariifolium TaxID=118510 RepID=A0A6L2K618_TANCI|nr:hypothetical protein [Tanacetum cinerariifolium]
MSKNDMKYRICTLFKNDLKDLVKTYRIPLDLHPRLPDPGFTMDHLHADAIGIYSEFLWFSGVRVPFLTFLLSVLKYFKDVCMDDGLSSLKKWKGEFFLIDRRAVLDYLTLRHSCLCVLDDLPSDGYDRNDVQRLCAHLIHIREMREDVLVHSGFSSVWFNKECDLVFRRINNNAGRLGSCNFYSLIVSDAKIVEESHHLSLSLLKRVSSHTTALAAEGAMVPLPTPDEIASSLPDPRLAKKSKELGQAEGMDDVDLTYFCVEIENSLEKDEGALNRAASAPIPCLGKRLGAPPSMAVVSASEPSYVGTSAHASIFGHSLSLGGDTVSGHARKSGAEVMWRQVDPLDFLARSPLARDVEYDQILKDDFGAATRGEEIDLTLFPLAPSPYHMSYLKALDQTITLAELRRTESLLPVELSNHVNVLSDLLVSHGYELNSRYTKLVLFSAHLQEKLNKKKEDVKLLHSERDVTSEEIRKMRSQLTNAKTTSARYKDAMDGLREEVTQFVGTGVESLVRKLLSTNEFQAALACVASLGINYGVERGLRMGRTNVQFEAAA